jgi:FixJ family two-component response regulator
MKERSGQKISRKEELNSRLNYLFLLTKMSEIIFIIDDDKSVRRSLSLFLHSAGYEVETYASSEEYLEREPFSGTGCIVLDVNLGGLSGPGLQEELIASGSDLPIIFITGQGTINMTVNALKKGAVNFLEKPFSDNELLQSVSEALSLSRSRKKGKAEFLEASKLVASLTAREHEILELIMTGMLNKQIAGELQIAEQTVKIHRQSICRKLGVKSVPEIIRIAGKAGIYD